MSGVEERWVLRADDQRTLDRRSEASGVAQGVLMESAGRNSAQWILDHMKLRRVVVLAGPGGNGGDALVVARCLHEQGIDVQTFALSPLEACSPATQWMTERLYAAGGDTIRVISSGDETLSDALRATDVVIDGLFGSGLSHPLGGEALQVAERVNAAAAKTVSLDLPSGLASDTGALLGDAVCGDVTLAMAFLKPAHLLYPAAAYCGNTAVISVDYPEAVLANAVPWARVLERDGARRRLPLRRPDGHKGSFGRVLVVAGSVGMTGAAILCCRAALRAGAGLVYLAAPGSLDVILETALPEVITIPLPDEDGHLTGIGAGRFVEAMERADVVAVGPGLSRASAAMSVVADVIERFPGSIVVDADGLCAVAQHPATLDALSGRSILTPHPGEFTRFVDRTAQEIDADRRNVASAFAEQHGCTLILKGRPTAIAFSDGDVYLNPTGNDGLATGGSGDVLTGLIAGFAAGGISLSDAAVVGTYVHGLAADVYARDRAARSMIPSDLLDVLPVALKELDRCG